MNKKMIFAVLAFFCLSTKSFAVDISGRVTTAEGEPVCALVLASGRSVFSCSPIGEYSLSGLALEPDGSVNLQVYAEGFYPFLRNITQFGPQTAVIMPRAGSCPVDDGLSNTGPLDGTYRLLRGSLIENDRSDLDTADPQSGFQLTGTMVISGSSMIQQGSGTVNGVPVAVSKNYTITDYGYGLLVYDFDAGQYSPMILVERGNKLVTFLNNNNLGTPSAEVLQWAKVTSAVTSLESDVLLQNYTPATPTPGGILSATVEGHGLKLMSDK